MDIAEVKGCLNALRGTGAVLDSYAQLAAQCTESNPTSIMQVGMFLLMVCEKQLDLMDSLEIKLNQLAKQHSQAGQETVSQNNSVKEV